MPTAFYYGARALVRPFVRLFWNPRVSGLDNVPSEGGYVMAANHLANVDSFLIPVVFEREVHFVSKDDFWKQPGLKGKILKTFFDQVGAVPLDREALSSGKGALQAGLEVLRAGHGFGIYPEGTRSKDGLLHPGKQGAAWLAIESGCPVVPVGVKNTPALFSMPWHRARGAESTRAAPPIAVAEIDPTRSKGARRRLHTARIMDEIQALSGQRRSEVPLPDTED